MKKLLKKLGNLLTGRRNGCEVASVTIKYIIKNGNAYIETDTSWGRSGVIYVPALFLSIAGGVVDERIISSIEEHDSEESAEIIRRIVQVTQPNIQLDKGGDDFKPSQSIGF